MGTRKAGFYPRHLWLTDAIGGCDPSLLSRVSAYLLNLGIGELRHPVTFARAAPVPPLFHHVSNIVCLRSKEKVIDIHAFGVVAFVANHCALGNFSFFKEVCKAMRPVSLLGGDAKLPIPLLVAIPRPLKAISIPPGHRIKSLAHTVWKHLAPQGSALGECITEELPCH